MRTMEDWEREFLELWNNLLDESATGTQEDILLVSRGKSITVKNNGKPFVLKNSLKESLGKKKEIKRKKERNQFSSITKLEEKKQGPVSIFRR